MPRSKDPKGYQWKCFLCGQRRGLHRHGDNACPNDLWKAGNGQDQWLTIRYLPELTATNARKADYAFKLRTCTATDGS